MQSMAPTTTIASGFCACEPIEVAMAAGKRPSAAVSEVITTGRTAKLGAAKAGLPDASSRGHASDCSR